jgi:hypothetical protein
MSKHRYLPDTTRFFVSDWWFRVTRSGGCRYVGVTRDREVPLCGSALRRPALPTAPTKLSAHRIFSGTVTSQHHLGLWHESSTDGLSV